MTERTVRTVLGDETLDLKALQEAFELYTRTARSMEESYRRLEHRVTSLDEELQAKNRELALTTEHLKSILESMTDGVIAVDNAGVITTFNHAASAILGFDAKQMSGRAFVDIFGTVFTPMRERRAIELRGAQGNVRVSARTAPIADRSGAYIGQVKVFQDLSEVEALREQVRRKDRLAALGEMAATVAHEIRNPLGGIRGFANLLERDTEETDPRMRLVRNVLAGVKNLERVVSELLEYTRPVELNVRPTGLSELVDAVIGYVQLDNKLIEIENAIACEVRAELDPDKMRQVLMNVLQNAVQSIASTGRIAITCGHEDHAVDLAIADSGCGMPPEVLDRVFSPFFTTKEKGTGLGLAVAAKIVESHGGRLVAESEAGKGSVFHIHLPIKD